MQAIAAYVYPVDGFLCRDTLFRLNDDAYLLRMGATPDEPLRWKKMTAAQASQYVGEFLCDMVAPGPVAVEEFPSERLIA